MCVGSVPPDPMKETPPLPPMTAVPVLMRSSSLGSPFLPNHFLPRSHLSFKALERPHSPKRRSALSPLLCFCFTASFTFLCMVCAHQSEFLNGRVSAFLIFIPPSQLCTHQQLSKCFLNKNHSLGFWVIWEEDSNIVAPSPTLPLQANVFSPLPSGINSGRLRTLCPLGRCHCGLSYLLDPMVTPLSLLVIVMPSPGSPKRTGVMFHGLDQKSGKR